MNANKRNMHTSSALLDGVFLAYFVQFTKNVVKGCPCWSSGVAAGRSATALLGNFEGSAIPSYFVDHDHVVIVNYVLPRFRAPSVEREVRRLLHYNCTSNSATQKKKKKRKSRSQRAWPRVRCRQLTSSSGKTSIVDENGLTLLQSDELQGRELCSTFLPRPCVARPT